MECIVCENPARTEDGSFFIHKECGDTPRGVIQFVDALKDIGFKVPLKLKLKLAYLKITQK